MSDLNQRKAPAERREQMLETAMTYPVHSLAHEHLWHILQGVVGDDQPSELLLLEISDEPIDIANVFHDATQETNRRIEGWKVATVEVHHDCARVAPYVIDR